MDGLKAVVWILFMNKDGTVKGEQKLSNHSGFLSGLENLGGAFFDWDNFGHALNPIGDLNEDGIQDLAVGADRDDDGGRDRGAVYILFMNRDGTVKSFQKISELFGNFTPNNMGGILKDNDHFGVALVDVGDLDGDGVNDIVVGAEQGSQNIDSQNMDDFIEDGDGEIFILFMNRDGTVKSFQKISNNEKEGLMIKYDEKVRFGHAISNLGDLDDDGFIDLAVGSHRDDDGGLDRGALWILLSHTSESQLSSKKQDLVPPEQTNLSPLSQWKLGIPVDNVICNYDLVLIIKKTSGQFACVKPQSVELLIERNWGMILN